MYSIHVQVQWVAVVYTIICIFGMGDMLNWVPSCDERLNLAEYCVTDSHSQSCVCPALVNNKFYAVFINWENVGNYLRKWQEFSLPTNDARVSYPKHHIWRGIALTHLFLHQFHGNASHSSDSKILCRRPNWSHARPNRTIRTVWNEHYSILHGPPALIAYSHVRNYSSYAWHVVCVRMCVQMYWLWIGYN